MAERIAYQSSQLPDSREDQGLQDERLRLCQMLLDKIRIARETPNDEADWTLDIVSEDT